MSDKLIATFTKADAIAVVRAKIAKAEDSGTPEGEAFWFAEAANFALEYLEEVVP